MILLLFIANQQVTDKFTKDLQGVNMVIGAKGSPLQIILSAVYHIDFPTGNIQLKDVQAFQKHPLIAQTIPMGLGDSYQGFRIVGTTTDYPALYNAKLAQGNWWAGSMEVNIGAEVAQRLQLKIGDEFAGSHGLALDGEVHEHPYKVVGILERTDTVIDRLILTAMESIWDVHEEHAPEEAPETAHDDHEKHEEHQATADRKEDREITALLLQFKSPMAAVMLPRQINATANLQAASPAVEMARLFNLIGVGTDLLNGLAYLLIFIALLNMFVVFYKALQERKYDLALLRTLGASPTKILLMIVTEGLLLATIGCSFACLFTHTTLYVVATYFLKITWLQVWQITATEIVVLLLTIFFGGLVALLPALQVYRIQMTEVLKKRM
jgi:putative ABC transport system permease protein